MLSIPKVSLEGHEDEANACLSALFLTDPLDDRAKLVQAKGFRVDGTCEWIQTNELYVSWLRSDSQLLWLSGGPGKGKTMLSIFLAEQLERITKDLSNTLFLQYFCDNKNERHNTGVTVMRGLLYQLLQQQPKFFYHILPSFKTRKESLFDSSSFETLWRIFETMLRDPITGTAYCILDGLDECDENSAEVLLGKFRSLFLPETKPSHHLKMIVVSRELPQFIPALLTGVPHIRLDPDADSEVNNDIQRFIAERVEQLPAYELCPQNLRVYMKKTFEERAQGTFLWVSLVAKALKKCRATEIRRKLDEFPPGLDEIYARMLLQIDANRREIAAKLLLWVVMAVRPLTLSDLGVAVRIEPSDDFTLVDAVKDHVLYCGYFLTIKEGDEIGLIHQSAKDYLLRRTCDSNPELEFFRVKEEVGNLEIARKCLNYLEDGALPGGPVYLALNHGRSQPRDRSYLGKGVRQAVSQFPLLSYATLHWYEHARSLSGSADIFNLSLPFYKKKSLALSSWLLIYRSLKISEYTPKISSLLHVASFFGILPLLRNLISQKWSKGLMNRMRCSFHINKKDKGGKTALLHAASNGHTAVVQFLREKGANIEARDILEQTALHITAAHGHIATVQLLLEMGADTEVKIRDGATALHIAAVRDYTAIVQLLFKNGANIEARNSINGTTLYSAAASGSITTVQFLLEIGANIEAATSNGETALFAAADRGYIDIMRLLLKKGASIEANDMRGDIWARICSRPEILELLVGEGATINPEYIVEGERLFIHYHEYYDQGHIWTEGLKFRR
jgi:hypothetical protein